MWTYLNLGRDHPLSSYLAMAGPKEDWEKGRVDEGPQEKIASTAFTTKMESANIDST